MSKEELSSKGTASNPVYPTLNVGFSTRLNGGRIRNNESLLKYTYSISAYDPGYHNQRHTDPNHLEKLTKQDGMVHGFREMYMDRELHQQRKFIDPNNKVHFIGPKILICVCMYNEGIDAINLTLGGIYDNLASLEAQGISSEQVAVVLVQDGILKLMADQKRRNYVMGEKSIVEFYRKMDRHLGKETCELEDRLHTILDSVDKFGRQGQSKNVDANSNFPPNIEKNVSLLYQNFWWPYLTETNESKKVGFEEAPLRKLKLFSCFKHLNGKKLSSHLWFFEGFCRYLKPEFIVLLDVGTKPGSEADNDENGLTNLIRGFYGDRNTGGVTGLMSIDSNFPSLEGGEDSKKQDESCCASMISCLSNGFASIEKAQEYEYIAAHFLDKNFESFTGFLHVLPGAWSAYRYIALIKSDKYEQNLLERSYFKQILSPQSEDNQTLEETNMYLAEDRILSLGIFCQKGAQYTLKYVPDAVAYTDPMKKHSTLLGQRRRWINSSLFAFLYVLNNYYFHVNESRHGCYRKNVAINVSMVFAALSFVNAYFTPSLYFFVLYVTIYQIDSSNQLYANLATCVSTLYCFILVAAVGGSLVGNEWEKQAHVISAMLSVFTFAMMSLIIYNVLMIYLDLENIDMSSFKSASVIYMLGINLGSYILMLLVHVFTHTKFVCKMLLDTPSYMSYQGAYSQTMVIYGMCNVDDVSWGTKGAVGSGQNKYFEQKVFFVSTWLVLNAILAYIFIYVDLPGKNKEGGSGGIVLLVIVIYSTFIIGFKSLLAILYFSKWLLTQKICKAKFEVPEDNVTLVKRWWTKTNQDYIKLQQPNRF